MRSEASSDAEQATPDGQFASEDANSTINMRSEASSDAEQATPARQFASEDANSAISHQVATPV